MAGRGLIIAAPTSGAGKTVVTLGLLRALADRGIGVSGVKAGPDYIDPAFHAAACRRPCINLDTWAMPGPLVEDLAIRTTATADLVLAEGVMGLFDGAIGVRAPMADGSAASLATRLGWPVVLVVDVRGMAASAAALVSGFALFQPEVMITGVIFNRVASDRHAAVLRQAMADRLPGIPILGTLPPDATLDLPERHLGLVQADEHPDLEAFLDSAGTAMARHVDLDVLLTLGRPVLRRGQAPGDGEAASDSTAPLHPLPPPGQRIALARDEAFAFAYAAVLDGWRTQGAQLLPFSPLADEGPDISADAIYLPGGYPELHAGQLAAAGTFLGGLRAAAARGATIYGECGGYMVLGRRLVDAGGCDHAMAGLLPVETSFAARRRHLGYRQAVLDADTPLGPAGAVFGGHEFHYASLIGDPDENRLFHATDAAGRALGGCGHRVGSVLGSFLHLIARR